MSASPMNDIEIYLMRLNNAMVDIPSCEREEFLREIKAHIVEKLRDGGAGVECVLRAVGEPDTLAQQFQSEYGIAVSSHSWSPFALMRTAARWALTGVQGFTIFVVGLIGYSTAAAFCITAALKPIFPDNIGFYVGEHGVNIAAWPVPQGRDLLGSDYTQVAFILGFALLIITSAGVRMMMRRFAQLRGRVRYL